MNLRNAIELYANAVSSRDYYDDREDAQRADAAAKTLHQRRQDLDALLAVAEAAIAMAEYQATSGYDPEVDSMTYTAERGRLWHAFIMARAKAANQ